MFNRTAHSTLRTKGRELERKKGVRRGKKNENGKNPERFKSYRENNLNDYALGNTSKKVLIIPAIKTPHPPTSAAINDHMNPFTIHGGIACFSPTLCGGLNWFVVSLRSPCAAYVRTAWTKND